MAACLGATDSKNMKYRKFVLSPSLMVRMGIAAIALVIAWVHCHYALVPVVKASAKTQQATRGSIHAYQLLERAAKDDKLSPAALNLNGRLHLQYYIQMSDKQPAMLKQAAQYFAGAVQRDKADFKNFEKLMIVYELLAKASPPEEALDWTQKAYDSGISAIKRYPGRGKLELELGKIAERLGKNRTAAAHYKKAIQIEDSYRRQFRLMYPEREMFSRLGHKKYQFAKERIAQLGE
jgi:tetratricopeptide (TPR) repeat protein